VIGVKEEDLFQPDDLLERLNKLKVLRTLQSLRRLHEGKTGYEYDKFEKANFDLDFLDPEKDKEEEEADPEDASPFSRRRRTTIKVKVEAPTRRRSLRLFQRSSVSESFSAHWAGELQGDTKVKFVSSYSSSSISVCFIFLTLWLNYQEKVTLPG